MSLNLHHLRYFHAIAQAGGLVKAADRLNVSPSAVSVQLQALEAQLGHDLFERRGRQLVLTEAGRMALERAEGQAVNDLGGAPSGQAVSADQPSYRGTGDPSDGPEVPASHEGDPPEGSDSSD